MKNQRKFSSLFVHRMQREVTILVMVVFMITCLWLAFLIHWTFEQALAQAQTNGVMGGVVETLMIFKRNLMDGLFISIGVGLFVVGFVVIKALHRAAGPLLRVANTLQLLGQGNIPKEIMLRERDYFEELAEETNQVIRRFKTLTLQN